jgi:hypothetical protein
MIVVALEKRIDLLPQTMTTPQEKTNVLTRTLKVMHRRMELEHLRERI